MPPRRCNPNPQDLLRALRFEIFEAAQILRMSRAQLSHAAQHEDTEAIVHWHSLGSTCSSI